MLMQVPPADTWGPQSTFEFLKNITILWGPVGVGAIFVGYLLKQFIWAKFAGRRPPGEE